MNNSYLFSSDRVAFRAECRNNIRENEADIHAFTVIPDDALFSDAEPFPRGNGLLSGMPVAIKDNIAVSGMQNSCCSNILKGYKATYDADVVRFLREAGAVPLGKTNMDEFAMGSTTESSCYGPTKNPLNRAYIPGGSSGGSAAAVASGMVPVALGSDTGGSIRQPASLCGIYGFKPTWGAISRYGLIAFASSLDQIGILSGSLVDLMITADVLIRKSERDMTGVDIARTPFFSSLLAAYEESIAKGEPRDGKVADKPNQVLCADKMSKLASNSGKKYRFAVFSGTESLISCPHTKRLYSETIEFLRSNGHVVEEIPFPTDLDLPLAIYYIIAPAEASSNLARYDAIRQGRKKTGERSIWDFVAETRSAGFGSEVLRRIAIGNYVLSSGYQDKYYIKAQKIRDYLIESFNKLYIDFDFVLQPTTPSYLKKIGEKMKPVDIYSSDIFTVTANITDCPAISVPVGINSDNEVGVGMHFMAKQGEDFALLEAVYSLYGCNTDA